MRRLLPCISTLGLLLKYLARHKRTLSAALILATINQSFRLLEPQITRGALQLSRGQCMTSSTR